MLKILARTPLRRPILAGIAVLAFLAAGAGLYGTARLWGNRGEASCAASASVLERLRPLARGEVAAFEVSREPVQAPGFSFQAPDGTRRDLASFRGRTVLLNLWATWCEPCKREMPALDRLQAELGGPRFEVAAVNIDTRNVERPRLWLAQAGVNNLAYYTDHEAKIFQDLRRAGLAEGMPTTVLVDPAGCRLGHMSGPAEWASPEALALIRAALGS
ncbi:thiol:disulfide interchange protein TlpA [Enterovirga aerilata]|uniref:Redoxin family protein n=1 Tax=Enterovirga aerilata TaxID=2730920 RepID=A0A849I2Y1_9HYPH|nr:TlpA family protein disulfide reductase [Enterovirga sp. DB1703]NNM71994.1 redoxin family protein [Enterovirga sp. DB1703]